VRLRKAEAERDEFFADCPRVFSRSGIRNPTRWFDRCGWQTGGVPCNQEEGEIRSE